MMIDEATNILTIIRTDAEYNGMALKILNLVIPSLFMQTLRFNHIKAKLNPSLNRRTIFILIKT